MRCSKCGTENVGHPTYCKVCGSTLDEAECANAEYNIRRRSRWMALFCAWLGCGVLQFWLGETELGKARVKGIIISALLCCFLVGIIMLLFQIFLNFKDFFYILFTKDEIYDAHGNPVTWR